MAIPATFKPDESNSEKERIISLVQAQTPPQGATRVEVVIGWHSSTKDPKNHLTVDYFIKNDRLQRVQIMEPKQTPQPVSTLTSSSATSASAEN
ncbi:hypothetical protein ST47_g6249 [Ascochyta rabiei]|uniref:Uncharacterized protein n=1 Tax=Didymella rabiei TaxID=5454 RepID=A0A163CT89_DIDRA|nr:hypothetical protein ST47_g6249 [Ascochyta rabiei]